MLAFLCSLSLSLCSGLLFFSRNVSWDVEIRCVVYDVAAEQQEAC